jgi:hypothetical protein
MRVKLAGAMSVLLLVGVETYAPSVLAEGGWAALGEALGGIGRGAPTDYQRDYQRDMEGRRLQAEVEARLDAQDAVYDKEARLILVIWWERWGLSAGQAQEVASAYERTPQQLTVLLALKRKGLSALKDDIERALDDYNYLLANQLAVASAVIMNQQQATQSTIEP